MVDDSKRLRSPWQIMFYRYCLLCLILSCRFVIGRLPKNVSPINSFEEYDGVISKEFSGVHTIVNLHRSFYVLSKNTVSSISITPKDGQLGGEYKIEEVINWAAPQVTDTNCRRKTTDGTACNNFIRIFAPKDASGTEFIVCGTHSSDPKCRIYLKQSSSFRKDASTDDFSGKSICPYDPKQTGASLYTGGDLYAATFEDLLGRKPVIYRHAISSSHENLEREKKHETWLRDPWFVKFVQTSPKVYILFKETAVEDNSGLTYTRVGQMCKTEAGGDRILRKQFTSFAKARLNCSFPGDPPFYFNEMAAASDFYQMPGNPSQKILFAAMNTPTNSIWGSAICAYTEQDIENTFQQPYLERVNGERGTTYWMEKQSDPAVTNALSKCRYDDSGKTVLSIENLQFIRDHPLKSHSVPTWSKDGRNRIPLFMKFHAGYQFTAITIDPNAGSTTQYLVAILGTTDGRILKVIPPLTESVAEAHFIGEMAAYDENKCGAEGDRRVRDIKIDDSSGYILIAFSSCIVSVPMCPLSHSTCKRACIAAQDPYCAWDGDKCTAVIRPSSFEQDVLGGNVDGLESCTAIPPLVVPPETVPGGEGNQNRRNGTANITNSAGTQNVKEETTKAHPVASASAFEFQWMSVAIGFAIGIILVIVPVLIRRCYRRRKLRGKFTDNEEKLSTKSSNHSTEQKRNSYGQRQDRPISNHTQRLHSRRSESSVDEEDAFLNGSDGNSNSFEKKSRRKRELSSNRKSNASSYRREDSTEQAPPSHVINRQTSRESNDSGLNGEMMVEVVDATQPPSPPNPGMHRTMSATAAQPRSRDLKRQLSLHIPNNHSAPVIGYHHSLTPMVGYIPQNPIEMHMQQQYPPNTGPMQQPHFDPSGPPTWHPSPAKNSKSMTGQHQTTSLDRKMLRAGGFARPPHGAAHDIQQQQQPRNYADTLPSHGMDDPRGSGRKRYPSESGVGNHRIMASKPSTYLPIQEEGSPLPDQNNPSQFPPNMQQRTASRLRPNHLPLSANNDGHFPMTNSTTTPMTEQQPPVFVVSPTQALPGHMPMRRHHSEMPVSIPQQQRHDMPHAQSAPTFYQPGINSKSNPTTPDVDPNHNSFFRDQIDPNHIRKRNTSGKSTTPTSNKEFPGHPEVIQPAATKQAVETAYLTTSESKDPAV